MFLETGHNYYHFATYPEDSALLRRENLRFDEVEIYFPSYIELYTVVRQ